MNKIRLFLTIALSAFIMNALVPAAASCLDAAQREALIASLPRGEAFENNGWNYLWLPTLKGAKTAGAKIKSAAGKTTADAVNDQTHVEQKGPFIIYKTSAAPEKSSTAAISGSSTYLVALNVQTQSLAVITGNIWLTLKDINDAGAIATEYGLTYSFSHAALSTSFYQIPAETDIQTLRKRLQTDARIIRVTLDMVDRIRRPR
ncbi:MAG: hypothetical protein K4571_18735 [Deltaproteobacteria bacterium]